MLKPCDFFTGFSLVFYKSSMQKTTYFMAVPFGDLLFLDFFCFAFNKRSPRESLSRNMWFSVYMIYQKITEMFYSKFLGHMQKFR